MNAPLESMHSVFGGSSAARILGCPGSVDLIEKVPSYLHRVSVYAERGSAFHTAMALLIERARSLDDLIGENVNGYMITADDVANALRPVLAYVEPLLDAAGATFYLEQRVIFPTVRDSFGAADLILRNGNGLRVIDFKFGSGVPVRALY